MCEGQPDSDSACRTAKDSSPLGQGGTSGGLLIASSRRIEKRNHAIPTERIVDHESAPARDSSIDACWDRARCSR